MLIFSVDYRVFIIVIVFSHVSNFYTLRSQFFTVFQVHVPIFSNICRVNNFYPSYFSSDVEKMHKEEIETENDDLKHHIRCYDCKFLRAQDTLRELKEGYSESKRYLPHLRYQRMKKMIERVIEKKELLQLD